MRIASIVLAAVLTLMLSVGGCTRGVDEEAPGPTAPGANSQESTPAPEPQQTQNEQPEPSGPETTNKPPMLTTSQPIQPSKRTGYFGASSHRPVFSASGPTAPVATQMRKIIDCKGKFYTIEGAVKVSYRGNCGGLRVSGDKADIVFEEADSIEVQGSSNKVVGDEAAEVTVYGDENEITVREQISKLSVNGDNNTFSSTETPKNLTDEGEGNTFDW